MPLQVAFPHLYNNRPRKVRLAPYHQPMVLYIKAEDPDLPAFYFDPLIHPLPPPGPRAASALAVEEGLGEEGDDWALPEGVEPLLAEAPLYTGVRQAGLPGGCCCLCTLAIATFLHAPGLGMR